MNAINVKYIPATVHRGCRIKATCGGRSITMPFCYGARGDSLIDQARIIVPMLIDKLGLDVEGYKIAYGKTSLDTVAAVFYND